VVDHQYLPLEGRARLSIEKLDRQVDRLARCRPGDPSAQIFYLGVASGNCIRIVHQALYGAPIGQRDQNVHYSRSTLRVPPQEDQFAKGGGDLAVLAGLARIVLAHKRLLFYVNWLLTIGQK
jgi:hypothetical protein